MRSEARSTIGVVDLRALLAMIPELPIMARGSLGLIRTPDARNRSGSSSSAPPHAHPRRRSCGSRANR